MKLYRLLRGKITLSPIEYTGLEVYTVRKVNNLGTSRLGGYVKKTGFEGCYRDFLALRTWTGIA